MALKETHQVDERRREREEREKTCEYDRDYDEYERSDVLASPRNERETNETSEPENHPHHLSMPRVTQNTRSQGWCMCVGGDSKSH